MTFKVPIGQERTARINELWDEVQAALRNLNALIDTRLDQDKASELLKLLEGT